MNTIILIIIGLCVVGIVSVILFIPSSSNSTTTATGTGTITSTSTSTQSATCTLAPLYRLRLVIGNTMQHMESMNQTEGASAGWVPDGVLAKICLTNSVGTVPLYRLYNSTLNRRMTSLSTTEGVFVFESILGYVYPSPKTNTQRMYRIVEPVSGDHMSTYGLTEGGAGWNVDIIEYYTYPFDATDTGGTAVDTSTCSQVDLYRLHIGSTQHMDSRITTDAGWSPDGPLAKICSANSTGTVPLYRLKNVAGASITSLVTSENAYTLNSTLGYVYNRPVTGTKRLYRKVNSLGDHLSTPYMGEGGADWKFDNIEYYAL